MRVPILAGGAAPLRAAQASATENPPIRVASHPDYQRPDKLIQTLHGASHQGQGYLYARRNNSSLHLPGNCTIYGPATITKKGDALVVEVGASFAAAGPGPGRARCMWRCPHAAVRTWRRGARASKRG
jgi:hypothetical protein